MIDYYLFEIDTSKIPNWTTIEICIQSSGNLAYLDHKGSKDAVITRYVQGENFAEAIQSLIEEEGEEDED